MELEPAEVRARRGYGWLQSDGALHGLDISRLNIRTLDVTRPDACVLAQTSGATYGRGMALAGRSGDINWAISHGFWETGPFGTVTQAWRKLLANEPQAA